eukprot:CAMPEP_0204325736 /NCGR_PEP_ID=MMETSP0469-20131031/11253_1 /ASSEMBLY_ACC=CAM_ASM_000384 /TAXON_ID=2969 /ORGANISM="Oxyrrhis marina" /LENGTH=367 /DNA_ID=CAMNT_0051307643 /DNA_START=125 /DNA_END=1225 /DNA_ORIENTATION=-
MRLTLAISVVEAAVITSPWFAGQSPVSSCLGLCQAPTFTSLEPDVRSPELPLFGLRFGDRAAALAVDDRFFEEVTAALGPVPPGPARNQLAAALDRLTAAANHLYIHAIEVTSATSPLPVLRATLEVAPEVLSAARHARAAGFHALKYDLYTPNATATTAGAKHLAWRIIDRSKAIQKAVSKSFRQGLGVWTGEDYPDPEEVAVATHEHVVDVHDDAAARYEIGFLVEAEARLSRMPEDDIKGLLVGAVFKLSAAQSKVERNRLVARAGNPPEDSLRVSNEVLGDILDLCRQARTHAYDVMKHDLYHGGKRTLIRKGRTTQEAKDLAGEVIELANELEREELRVVKRRMEALLRGRGRPAAEQEDEE